MSTPTQLARLLCLTPLLLGAPAALGLGEASTRFVVYAPPNNENMSRFSMIIVTAVTEGATTVDLVDDGADGDTDDTVNGIQLTRGQSYIRYIKDGAVNDDAGGKWDGDLFIVTASLPVITLVTTKSDWQHDWVPADNKTSLGQRFYIYSPATSASDRDLDVFAYSNETAVELYDITASSPVNASGKATVDLVNRRLVMRQNLAAGEDLLFVHGLGVDILKPDRTYELVASRPITALTGALATLNAGNSARDGASFVPSSNGSSVGDLFYFAVVCNPGMRKEQELRILSADANTTVRLDGFNVAAGTWEPIFTVTLANALDHHDMVGSNYDLFRLQATNGRVAVYEANWMETGSPGTSDDGAFASAETGMSAGKRFLCYMGPPGLEKNAAGYGDYFSHLYIFGHVAGTQVTVKDADTLGSLYKQTFTLNADGMADARVTVAQYNALNKPAQGIRPYLLVEASRPVSVMDTNWNDNWMTYVGSVLVANPEVRSTTIPTQATCNSTFEVCFEGRNTGSASLGAVGITLSLPADVKGLSSTAALNGAPLQPGTLAGTFSAGSVAPGDTLKVCASLVSSCLDNTGHALASGSLLTTSVLISGSDGLDTYVTQATSSARLVNSLRTDVQGLQATGAEGSITVAWNTPFENELKNFTVTVAASGDAAGVLVGTLLPKGEAGGGATYSLVQAPVTPGTRLFYKLRANFVDGSSADYGPVSAVASDTTPPPVPTIQASMSGAAVQLGIMGGAVSGDLGGYRIYRQVDGGAWNLLKTLAVTTDPAQWQDTSVEPGHACSYTASSVDVRGNASAQSSPATVQVPYPVVERSQAVLVFEDAKGSAINDWDYNDLVVSEEVEDSFTTQGLAKRTLTYTALARGAFYHHRLTARLMLAGKLTVTRTTTTPGSKDPPKVETLVFAGGAAASAVDLVIFEDTRDALPVLGDWAANTKNWHACVAGQTVTLVVVPESASANPVGPPRPESPDVFLQVTWPQRQDEIHQATRNGVDDREPCTLESCGQLKGAWLDFAMRIPAAQWQWPQEDVPIWEVYPDFPAWVLAGKSKGMEWTSNVVTQEVSACAP